MSEKTKLKGTIHADGDISEIVEGSTISTSSSGRKVGYIDNTEYVEDVGVKYDAVITDDKTIEKIRNPIEEISVPIIVDEVQNES